MNKQILRWLTIVLPVILLAIVLVVTDLIVFGEIHYLEIIISVVLIAIGAVVFSNWVFAQLDAREFEIRKRAAQLEALNLSGLSLITELDLGVVLQKVVDLSRELVSARYGALGVLNDQATGYQQFITSGITKEQRAEIGAPPQGRGLFRYLIDEGKPLIVEDISKHEHSYGFPENHPVMRSMIAVPIKNKGKVIGNLYLTEKIDPWNPHSDELLKFDEEDLRILELFATQSAIAIENARLYRHVQQLAVLEERQRFGMDLHDGVIQSIYAVGLMLESIAHQVDRQPELAKQGIEDSIESLNTAIRDIRNYILDLRPQHFQGRNIVQGVEELARALRANTFMDVYVEITDVDSDAIGPEKTVEVLHIAQEALQNIQKHAQASEVSIALRSQNGNLMLEILDNGISIKPQQLRRSLGNGLMNMQERASSLNGEIIIGPKLEGGTEVRLTIPLQDQ
ncbi:MAG: GAF domain-containing sensor histidine kinase [Anaerolineales bacterium]|nr:GAF domain-containing sensor histidine kinase [Anaerolineales bacterium]